MAEVEQALSDYDYVIGSTAAAEYQNVHYFAGHAAFNDLEDETRAGSYWLECAAFEHMGCMNIVADGYFGGQYGLEVSYEKSSDYHTKVFDSGVEGRCAGVFSGVRLARMSVFLPQVDYRLAWDEWLEESFELQEQLADTFDMSNICAKEVLTIDSYLLHLANDIDRTHLLEDIITKNVGSPSVTIANYFVGNIKQETVVEAISQYDEFVKCQSLVQLSTHAKLTGRFQLVDTHQGDIKSSDQTYCAGALTWSNVLKAYQPEQ